MTRIAAAAAPRGRTLAPPEAEPSRPAPGDGPDFAALLEVETPAGTTGSATGERDASPHRRNDGGEPGSPAAGSASAPAPEHHRRLEDPASGALAVAGMILAAPATALAAVRPAGTSPAPPPALPSRVAVAATGAGEPAAPHSRSTGTGRETAAVTQRSLGPDGTVAGRAELVTPNGQHTRPRHAVAAPALAPDGEGAGLGPPSRDATPVPGLGAAVDQALSPVRSPAATASTSSRSAVPAPVAPTVHRAAAPAEHEPAIAVPGPAVPASGALQAPAAARVAAAAASGGGTTVDQTRTPPGSGTRGVEVSAAVAEADDPPVIDVVPRATAEGWRAGEPGGRPLGVAAPAGADPGAGAGAAAPAPAEPSAPQPTGPPGVAAGGSAARRGGPSLLAAAAVAAAPVTARRSAQASPVAPGRDGGASLGSAPADPAAQPVGTGAHASTYAPTYPSSSVHGTRPVPPAEPVASSPVHVEDGAPVDHVALAAAISSPAQLGDGSWTVSATLQPPALGQIWADVHVSDGSVRVSITAASEDGHRALAAHLDQLAGELGRGGRAVELTLLPADEAQRHRAGADAGDPGGNGRPSSWARHQPGASGQSAAGDGSQGDRPRFSGAPVGAGPALPDGAPRPTAVGSGSGGDGALPPPNSAGTGSTGAAAGEPGSHLDIVL